MKLKDISGKKIVGIREVRDQKSSGKWDRFVDALVLDDGTELRPIACELEHGDGYGVQFVVVRNTRAPDIDENGEASTI